ncbi:MAG: alanine racemase [Candidatus Competibacteraceae bacterium]
MLADSRPSKIFWALREMGVDVPLLLLRLPTLSRVAEVVRVADMSLVSSLVTIKALAGAARSEGRCHRGILMVDVGDLREGVWPDRAVEIVRSTKGLSGFELVGLGCNLACFGGVMPTPENIGQLVALREICRRRRVWSYRCSRVGAPTPCRCLFRIACLARSTTFVSARASCLGVIPAIVLPGRVPVRILSWRSPK